MSTGILNKASSLSSRQSETAWWSSAAERQVSSGTVASRSDGWGFTWPPVESLPWPRSLSSRLAVRRNRSPVRLSRQAEAAQPGFEARRHEE